VTDYSLRRYNKYTDADLVDEARRVAAESGSDFLTGRQFERGSGIAVGTIERRFGTWRRFCESAGLKPGYTRTDDRIDLFANLEAVWQALGRQPRAKEMKRPLSAISCSRYLKEFGSWHAACLEFLAWKTGMTATALVETPPPSGSATTSPLREPRQVSLSVRYEVMKRDGFKCVRCGRSPAIDPGVQIHIDHRIPRSLGGTSTTENLQTLCLECNLGKGNRHID
jgi:hypothetical protein